MYRQEKKIFGTEESDGKNWKTVRSLYETPAHLYEFSSRGCISLGHFVKLTYTIRAEITSDNYRPYADEISTVPAQNSAKLRWTIHRRIRIRVRMPAELSSFIKPIGRCPWSTDLHNESWIRLPYLTGLSLSLITRIDFLSLQLDEAAGS